MKMAIKKIMNVIETMKLILIVGIFASLVLSGEMVIAFSSEGKKDTQEQYSPEVLYLLEKTYLGHASQLPDPGEPIVVLKKYLEANSHKNKPPSLNEIRNEVVQWEHLSHRYPESRHAYVGLAKVYMAMANLTQDKEWLGMAAENFIEASKIGLKYGRIRYTREISELMVTLNDKAGLDDIFGRILSISKESNRKEYYLALVDYADGLAKLQNFQKSWALFEEAIGFYPDNNTEAINRFVGHLLNRNEAVKALEILDNLTTEQRVWDVTPAYMRKKALTLLGLDTSSADKELEMVKMNLTPKGGKWSLKFIPNNSIDQISSIASTPPWSHDVALDDCRNPDLQSDTLFCRCPLQSDMEPIPGPGYGMFYADAINAAEVIYNEARGETKGAQDMVMYVIKDRALLSLNCDHYPGQNTVCNTPCTESSDCALSQKYCCAIHGGTT